MQEKVRNLDRNKSIWFFRFSSTYLKLQARRKRGDWGDFSLPAFDQNTLFVSISKGNLTYECQFSSFFSGKTKPWSVLQFYSLTLVTICYHWVLIKVTRWILSLFQENEGRYARVLSKIIIILDNLHIFVHNNLSGFRVCLSMQS